MHDEVLKGKLSEKDAQEIKDVLQAQKEAGNRFAAIPLTKDRLTKEDLSFHRSAFDAWKTLDQHTGRTNEFLYRSITLLQDEVDKQLDVKKEKGQQPDKQPEDKRSRDHGMSR